MKKTYKPIKKSKKANNRISEVVHETAKDLFAVQAIDKTTMHEFDALCLPDIPRYTAKQVQTIRTDCRCSQSVFAKYLNVSPSSLKQWETGTKKPGGIACKLLNIVESKSLEVLL